MDNFIADVGMWVGQTFYHKKDEKTLNGLLNHIYREIKELEEASTLPHIKEEASNVFILLCSIVYLWDLKILEQYNFRVAGDDHQIAGMKLAIEQMFSSQFKLMDNGVLSITVLSNCHCIVNELFSLARYYQFNLLEESKKKMEINKRRRWTTSTDGSLMVHVK